MTMSEVHDHVLSPAAAALSRGPSAHIAGAWVDGEGSPFSTIDPFTEKILAEVNSVTVTQAEAAIRAARATFDDSGWSRWTPMDRSALLLRLVDGLEAHRNELIDLIVTEVGSPITLARGMQVGMPIENFRWFAEAARRGPRDGLEEGLPLHHQPVTSASLLVREPVGVVAAMTAYNYPFNLIAWKLGAALASGCTVVLMPSPRAVLCTVAFMRVLEEAGCPPGVVNLVVGGPDVGEVIATDPRVDMVSFTGSASVGAHVMGLAARTVKKVVLELGGKSPNIVLPGTDAASVLGQSVLRFCRNAGQGCGATTRMFVPRADYDAYAELMAEEMRKLAVGDPHDEHTDVGPLITQEHRDRVKGFVDRAVASGAELLVGGAVPASPATGFFFEPTLVGGIGNDAEIAQEELFGPVGVLLPYDDVEDLVAKANASRFGLNANVWGATSEAMAIARRLRSGTVSINGGGGMRPDAPWGGPGQSGVGREMGEDGLREFYEVKHIQWPVDGP
jgi:aldehyde dehydrogenase (NAD+)/betaine-aldehyde dehydrogenase